LNVGLKPTLKTTCTGVEMFRKLLDEGRAGDNVGVFIERHEARRSRTWTSVSKPGHNNAPHDVEAKCMCSKEKEDGTRHFSRIPAPVLFRTTDVTGECQLPEGVEMVMPGDNNQW